MNLDAVGGIDMLPSGLVIADLLVARAGAAATLETAVNRIDALIAGTGALQIDEADDLGIVQATTGNGSIRVAAGGALTAQFVMSQTDAEDNDIALTAFGGGMTLGSVNAGNAGDLTLAAFGPIVQADGGQTAADALAVLAFGPVTLATQVNSIEAVTFATGDLTIQEVDDVVLRDIATADGSVRVTAGGSVSAVQVLSQTDSDANDIQISAGGAIEPAIWKRAARATSSWPQAAACSSFPAD